MSQSFIKQPDQGPHSALAGLGVLRSELPKPFARLHDDGHWTMEPGTEPYKSRFAGWSADVYSTEQVRDAFDVLRRIVAWRDSVHEGRVVRGSELESLIEECRSIVQAPGSGAAYGKPYGTKTHTVCPLCDAQPWQEHAPACPRHPSDPMQARSKSGGNNGR